MNEFISNEEKKVFELFIGIFSKAIAMKLFAQPSRNIVNVILLKKHI